jgi:divalent metal cation (Fe/Co/Zn/Cd) transporter
MGRETPVSFAWLSIGAAMATIALKVTAYVITDSAGLLSVGSAINLGVAPAAEAEKWNSPSI